ncbi:ribonuclease H-like domain-containing protein [Tanacetum coccineum]
MLLTIPSKTVDHTCLKDLTMLIYKADKSDQGIFDSGCSRHMTGNKSFLTDYQEIDGGFVAFGGSPKGVFSFTETECLVLSPDSNALDEVQCLLKFQDMTNFCGMKGIKWESGLLLESISKWSCCERKNRTLIEAARTMLSYSLLPTTFWAEAVNTACYVENRVLVTKPHNTTPYELLHGRPPSISFMRPFGCCDTP